MTLAALTEMAAGTVGAAHRQLPAPLREIARGVAVHYEMFPGADVLAEGFEPDILGLFVGAPHGETGEAGQVVPPQIFLYLRSLWEYAESDAEIFREEVRLTYLHELGHFLGWDEDAVAARGLD